MTKEQLHQWRLFIPGIIIVLCVLPFFITPDEILKTQINSYKIIYILAVLILGGVYYALRPRGVLQKKAMGEIQLNIKTRLFSPFETNGQIKPYKEQLFASPRLIDIFYQLIDNDKSLSERAKEVFFNGLILSTFADLVVITPFAIVLYGVSFLISKNFSFLIIGLLFGVLFVLSVLIHQAIVKRHFELSNLQLTYIIQQKKIELENLIITCIKNLQ